MLQQSFELAFIGKAQRSRFSSLSRFEARGDDSATNIQQGAKNIIMLTNCFVIKASLW